MQCHQPTLILSHASVLTMDPQRPRAEAIAVRHGCIVAVGTNAAVLPLRAPATTVIDCHGAAVLPGFIDAHLHLRALAATLRGIDCGPRTVQSLAALRTLLHREAHCRPAGQWLVGYGYDDFALAERRHPTRWDLDAVTSRHPVRLAHRSRHAWVLNSSALAQLGITRDFQVPPGGVVERDPASGEPTGLLIDMDDYLRRRIGPSMSAEEFRQGVRCASQSLLAAGVTTILDASVSNDLTALDSIDAWISAGDLEVRVSLLLGAESLHKVGAGGWEERATPLSLGVHGIKIRLDEGSGSLYPAQEVLNEQVWNAHQQGLPVAIHAVEPSALVAALHAIRMAQQRRPRPDIRHRIEHGAVCPEACLDELAELHVAVVTQPAFLWHHGSRYLAEIEPEQHPWLYRVKSLLARGVPVAGSSDAPVVPAQPLEGVYAAITRQSMNGQVIAPAECVDAETALWLFTQGAAWVCGLEGVVGSIAPGKLADLVVLEADPTRVPIGEVREIPVRMTFVGGIMRWGATG